MSYNPPNPPDPSGPYGAPPPGGYPPPPPGGYGPPPPGGYGAPPPGGYPPPSPGGYGPPPPGGYGAPDTGNGGRRARRYRRALWVGVTGVALAAAVVVPIELVPGGTKQLSVAPVATSPPPTTISPPPTNNPFAPRSTRPSRPQRTTNTTLPAPPTTQPAPPTTQPAPPASQPAPPTTQPAPTTTAPPAPPSTLPRNFETATLPVVPCPTTRAVPPPEQETLPQTVQAEALSQTQAAELSAYTDDQGTVVIVAPIGWNCTAIYNASGAGGVAAYPPGEMIPNNWTTIAQPAGDFRMISGFTAGQDADNAALLACGLFPAANNQLVSDGLSCTNSKPEAETTSPVNAAATLFLDPPGVEGSGFASGSGNDALGVITYNASQTPGSWINTCVLPDSDTDICLTDLENWVVSYGQ